MKENKYDDDNFFTQYNKMRRSVEGLNAAGEWHELRKMLPELTGKSVLDLGCGFGWHCRFAMENGAASAVGIDISEKMLARAREINSMDGITYVRKAFEDISYPPDKFDLVISSLAFHYTPDFDAICGIVKGCLKKGGTFVFSVEHPIFTAAGPQDWHYDGTGNKMHWPVDRYFEEGWREAVFLGEPVVKYHKTLTTYLKTLLTYGFEIRDIMEPEPEKRHLQEVPGMADELRRPMMLLVSAGLH